jgi:hypothetical protein
MVSHGSLTGCLAYWSVLFPCLALKNRFQIQRIADEIYLLVREEALSELHTALSN